MAESRADGVLCRRTLFEVREFPAAVGDLDWLTCADDGPVVGPANQLGTSNSLPETTASTDPS